jgi:hypothetical protein
MDGNNRVFYVMENVEKMICKGRDDIDKAKTVLNNNNDLSKSAKEILGGMLSAFDHFTDGLEALASVVVDYSKRMDTTRPIITGNKAGPAKQANPANPTQPPVNPAEVKKNKFCQAVRDADKTLLVYKMDLGKVPIMNTGTMSRHVTQDIVRKAAKVEGQTTGRPNEDTVVTLEDTLSMVTGMEFLGRVTKPYANRFNDKDPENGSFHTLPVKLSFKTKEAKTRAEKVFKKNCKLQCSTPYPKRLRQLIAETVAAEKSKHAGCFIQVKVDLDGLQLKISRRTDTNWINDYHTIKIDSKVMDTDNVTNAPGNGNAL